MEHIRSNQKKKANALSKLSSMTFEHLTKEAKSIIKEIHEGFCGFNAEPCSMVVNVTKQGYYWPSMYKDAAKMIQDCTQCQAYSTMARASNNNATTINSTLTFSHWGINILRPLPTAPGSLKFLAIADEQSTKWVEAKPLTIANGRQTENFVWEHIICSFRVPQTITSKDNK
ncbi:reverse transcriptase domain-containing protein [Tanacetum coccineum]